MSASTPLSTAASPWTTAFTLQSAWLTQMAGWQTAWFNSVLEMQRQVVGQDWMAQAPWMRWAVWHNGTEQLA
jgi:hypothetical protein